MNKTISLSKLAAVLPLCAALAVPAVAQPVRGVELSPGTRVHPEFGVALISDSNFYNTSDDKESAIGSVITPGIRLESNTTRSQLSAGALAELGFFDTGDRDDYVDTHIYGRYKYKAGTRHRFSGGLARRNDHDAFGRRRTEGSTLEDQDLDEFDQNVVNLGYRYGATNALFNVQFDLNYIDREYTTNRDRGTRFLDFDRFEQRATLYYNVSPKTSVLFKVSNREIDYPATFSGFPDRAASERRASIGVEWLATGKTTGRLFVGGMKREPDSNQFKEFSGADWALNLEWSPRATTVVNVTAVRESDESFLVNSSFIDTKRISLSWKQFWNRVFWSDLGVSGARRDFEDIGREDDTSYAELSFNLKVARESHIFAKMIYSERDSNFDVRDYDKSIFQIGYKYQR